MSDKILFVRLLIQICGDIIGEDDLSMKKKYFKTFTQIGTFSSNVDWVVYQSTLLLFSSSLSNSLFLVFV